MPYEHVTPESDPDGHGNKNLATQFDDPATVKRAEENGLDKPAQVTPEMKKHAERHPEDVPPPGDMGPDQGPSS